MITNYVITLVTNWVTLTTNAPSPELPDFMPVVQRAIITSNCSAQVVLPVVLANVTWPASNSPTRVILVPTVPVRIPAQFREDGTPILPAKPGEQPK